MRAPREGVCCLCGGEYRDYGHNAAPIMEGRCCAVCNEQEVIPTRIFRMLKPQKESQDE